MSRNVVKKETIEKRSSSVGNLSKSGYCETTRIFAKFQKIPSYFWERKLARKKALGQSVSANHSRDPKNPSVPLISFSWKIVKGKKTISVLDHRDSLKAILTYAAVNIDNKDQALPLSLNGRVVAFRHEIICPAAAKNVGRQGCLKTRERKRERRKGITGLFFLPTISSLERGSLTQWYRLGAHQRKLGRNSEARGDGKFFSWWG